MRHARQIVGAFARRLGQDSSGGTALEFSLIVPVFLMLVVGVITCAQLTNAVSSMNYAVQEAARCYALDSVRCGNANAVAAFARTKYLGPGINPAFGSADAGCGRRVTASATYRIDVILARYDVPLNAAACFPAPPV